VLDKPSFITARMAAMEYRRLSGAPEVRCDVASTVEGKYPFVMRFTVAEGGGHRLYCACIKADDLRLPLREFSDMHIVPAVKALGAGDGSIPVYARI
jgi:hypothetical protein